MKHQSRMSGFARTALAGFVLGGTVWMSSPVDTHAQSFTRITTGAIVNDGGASRSVNWIDVDRNGTLDLFVSNGPSQGERAFLYRNDGAPAYTFTKVTNDAIVGDIAKADGASFGDYDNDGAPDACMVTWYGDVDYLYRNTGDGTFTKIVSGDPVTTGGYSETCVWGDYDNDGRLDLYVTNSGNTSPQENFLYHNEGSGVLSRIDVGAPTQDIFTSRGATWIDYDGDGDIDLFVANEASQPNNLYRNMLVETGSVGFEPVTGGAIVTDAQNSFSGSWGDYDNDGDPDLFVANWSNQNNALYRNEGGDTFTRITTGPHVNDGGYSVCTAWGDFDNDGDLDLFVTNAYGSGRKVNFLYKNRLMETGAPDFEKITTGAIVTDLGWSYGCAWGDYDADGDLDLFTARTYNNNENNALYRNDLVGGNRWLECRTEGVLSNRSGIGARIRIRATIGGVPRILTRTIEGQSGYCGQNLIAHFGLGDAATIDTLRVDWPSGMVDVTTGVATNRPIILREGAGVADAGDAGTEARFSPTGCLPNPGRDAMTIWYHLPAGGETELTVFDVEGRRVRSLVRGWQPAGRHEVVWDGMDGVGRGVSPGVYLYRMKHEETIGGGRLVRLP